MKKITLLGATGSIGTNTVDVVLAYPEKFQIVAFSFYQNLEKGRQLIRQLQPKYVAVGTEEMAFLLQKEFPKVSFGYGVAGLTAASTLAEIDVVLTAVTGSIGLLPTLAAIKAGKEIALANKETLVMGGELVMKAAEAANVSILPVDSEHSAIFQCLQGQQETDVDHLVITASGGSFRDLTREALKNVTLEGALNHPNWSMGAKITIDSATMMNKGLEVIEAHWLFQKSYDKIKVVLHRESIVHSMVVLKDGAYLAQLGASDMREPIQYALTYPRRLAIAHPKPFDLTEIGALHFEKMDFQRFPLLQLAYEVGEKGDTFPTVYNAANEVAVAAFLKKKIAYLDIEILVFEAVERHQGLKVKDIETLLEVDKEVRRFVEEKIRRL